EPLARAGLRVLLERDSEIGAIHEARDGREALASIRAARPDLVFLDVQMPEMDGFEVVRQVGAANMPVVVFVTAHDQYGVQAFEINAIDYLLKPVTEQRFAQALERVRARLKSDGGGLDSRQIRSLLESLAAPKQYVKRLAVRASGRVIFVDADEIDW